MKNLLILLATCTFLFSCTKEVVSVSRSNNPDIPVELLFEYDGVKVYRFKDNGRSIYYTDARGKTEWHTGKHSTKQSVETVE